MFFHGYHSYMTHAFPADELMPLSCKGRFRERKGRGRGDIDDVLGNFSLTLVDSLDTLVIMDDLDEFERAIRLTIDNVHFDRDVVVSVFESNIRMLGGLLSAHMLAEEIKRQWEARQQQRLHWYSGELLEIALKLGHRLLPAFDTATGLPHPLINLRHGLRGRAKETRSTCAACAGTLILEFATLSRLSGEAIFEEKVRHSMDYIWGKRNLATTLIGSIIDVQSGEWIQRESGVGAGIDSYYEYMLKASILLGDDKYLFRFARHYDALKKYLHNGTKYGYVEMDKPKSLSRPYVDALVAFFPGLQVLYGDVDAARESHGMLHHVHRKYNFLPEAFTPSPELRLYWSSSFLRPEFIESTYFLYEATRDPYYLQVGKELMRSLERYARVTCGYAVFSDLRTYHQEDRMDSYFLTETLKYLYLLFSEPSDIAVPLEDYIFTTEGHLLPLSLSRMRLPVSRQTSRREAADARLHRRQQTIGGDRQTCPRRLWQPSNLWSLEALQSEWTARSEEFRDATPQCRPPSVGDAEQTLLGERRLRVHTMDLSDPKHIKILHEMGISVLSGPGEQFQLLFNPSAAESLRDVAEGRLFMQEISTLMSDQEGKTSSAKIGGKASSRRLDESSPSDLLADRPITIRLTVNQSSDDDDDDGGDKDGDGLITANDVLAGVVDVLLEAKPAHFGRQLAAGERIDALLAVASPLEACSSLEKGVNVGRIVITRRGNCMFVEKARNIEESGGVGMIVLDNVGGTSARLSHPFAMSGDDDTADVGIPAAFLYSVEAAVLMSLLSDHGFEQLHAELNRPTLPADTS